MAVRTPVKLDGFGNIVAMDATDIANIKAEMIRQYRINPSVTISNVGSGGNLGAITDTRYQAGNAAFSISAIVPEVSTEEPTQLTVNYSLMNENISVLSAPPDTDFKAFPLFLDGSNNLQSMTLTDVYDTFVNDVITSLTTADQTTAQAGTYVIHTSSSLAGATLAVGVPIFVDSRADLTQYAAATIPEALDQPVTIASYWLHIIDAAAEGAYPNPMYIRTDDNIQQYTTVEWQTLLQNAVRYFATQTGSRIDYALSSSPSGARGSGMVNTDFTGVTGNYQGVQINADDYRAQEFPNGTVTTIATTYLVCARG